MTTRQLGLIRETFPRLQEMAGPLAQLFYGRLFQLDPAIRPLFRGDVRAQGVKLMDMLTALVQSLDRPEEQTAILHALGQRHAGYGVKPAHYESVKAAFGWALGQALQLASTSEVKAAWLALIDEVNAAMKSGAAELTR